MSPRFHRHLVASAAVLCAACSGKSDGGPGVPHGIAIQPGAAALCVGDSLAFTAEVLDNTGKPVLGAQVRWSSSAPEAVAIDSVSGLARALQYGGALITATAGGVRSANPAAVDVPSDLSPEFVPDTAVLAPGDTMTLGVRWRRLLAPGPVPADTPGIAPFDSVVARLDASGLVTAKAQGVQGLSLSACGFTGHGAVRVFTPSDTATGYGYLWLSGPAEMRLSLPAKVVNFLRRNGGPAFQVVSAVGATSPSPLFIYEDTLALVAAGRFGVDSLASTEVDSFACARPRPAAFFYRQTPSPTLTVSLGGGQVSVTTFVPEGSFTAVSGRALLSLHGIVNGSSALDTLQAIYTFSAPLVSVANACQ